MALGETPGRVQPEAVRIAEIQVIVQVDVGARSARTAVERDRRIGIEQESPKRRCEGVIQQASIRLRGKGLHGAANGRHPDDHEQGLIPRIFKHAMAPYDSLQRPNRCHQPKAGGEIPECQVFVLNCLFREEQREVESESHPFRSAIRALHPVAQRAAHAQ